MNARLLRCATASLVTIGALLGSACSAPLDESSGESEAAATSAGIPVGGFLVRWKRDTRQVAVTRAGVPGRVVWETPAGGDFVHVARGRERVESARGCFLFEDQTEAECGGAVLERVEARSGKVVATGTLTGCGARFELSFEATPEGALAFELDARPGLVAGRTVTWNRTALTFASQPTEAIYGFGHQYSRLDMKGARLPIWSGEQGIGRGQQPISAALSLFARGAAGDWSTTYTAVPAFVSSDGRGFVLDNSEYTVFDMTRPDRIEVETWSRSMRGKILRGGSVLEAVSDVSENAGRMAPLPAWTQAGALLRVRGGSAEARKKLREARDAGARIAAIWIEDWVGERETPFGLRMYWNWEVDRGLYPDWERLVRETQASGVRVLVYFNPFLADVSAKPNVRRNLHAEAKAQGLLVRRADGELYPIGNGGFDAGLIDLTSPKARTFIKDLMKEQLALGVSGWMADFGEALPYDAVLASGADPRSFHNLYTRGWASLNREAIREAGREGDALFFSRSGDTRSPGATMAFWIGDQNTTWDAHDGIKTVIPALLSGGMSGYALDHMDVGGWLSLTLPVVSFTRSKELQQRWMELGAFGALLRLHHTNRPGDNWQYDSDADTLKHFARMTKLFAALAPYRAHLMAEAHQHGYPLVRHPILHHPNDPAVRHLDRQFLLGSELMVAPVLDANATSVDVYLPAGEWVHVWSGRTFGRTDRGGRITVAAPIGQPAILHKRGSREGEALVGRLRTAGLL